jgi:hypothetical protein
VKLEEKIPWGITDSELLVTENMNRTGFTTIELSHSTNIRKGNKISFFKAVTIIHNSDQSFLILYIFVAKKWYMTDITNKDGLRIGIINIRN